MITEDANNSNKHGGIDITTMSKDRKIDETRKASNAEGAVNKKVDDSHKADNAGGLTEEANEGCCGNRDTDCGNGTPDCSQESTSDGEAALLKEQLDDKTRQCGEYLNQLQRTAAEFDNYKKRTTREKEALYSEAVSDVVTAFLPVVDSIERAMQACSQEYDKDSLREGIELVQKQVNDVMKNLGIEETKSIGEEFNPQLHNAVMHISDESSGTNIIVEEFQKGYKFRDKVVRYSMVKVAN
jgi:molecular chaperone GrpE